MTTRAGQRDRRIELQTKATNTWTTQAPAWARKVDAAAVQRFTGRQFESVATHAYVIPYRTDVTAAWRVKENDEAWRILGVFEGEGRRRETVVLVERFTTHVGRV